MFASRNQNSSFGLLKLDGIPDVQVYANNNPIGKTDRTGKVVIPYLAAYQRNVIRIDDGDLPMDAMIENAEISIRPYARTGNVIDFPIRRERGALLQVKLEGGSFLPAGTIPSPADGSASFITALGGEVYASDLRGSFNLKAVWKDGRCSVTGTVPDNTDPQPRLKGLTCKEETRYVSK